MASNIYVDLTWEFNAGRLRAVISSGQAVVLHRLAIMSKDGDWILREDAETVDHVLHILSRHGATYRFGAPLDLRWLTGGWSSHFEFRSGELRVRTDFVTRPPRLSREELCDLWKEQEGREIPVVGLVHLAKLKMTDREKDYAVIGELATQMTSPRERFLYSRSARDLLALARAHPELLDELRSHRPVLGQVPGTREAIEAALDAERRLAMRANERRLDGYRAAAREWIRDWPTIEKQAAGLRLEDAHALMVRHAERVLPSCVKADHGTD